MLMDFGSGNYPCTGRLTWQPLPPGTPLYQSPQALWFERTAVPTQEARYQATPADDVYALGVTAYRLVTGEYPPGHLLWKEPDGTWRLEEDAQPSPRERNPRVDPQLSALILRMLSLSPEARGTAGELAEALEAATDRAEREHGERLAGTQHASQRLRAWMPFRDWRTVSAALLTGAVLTLGLWRAVHEPPAQSIDEPAEDSPHDATADLGDRSEGALPRNRCHPSRRRWPRTNLRSPSRASSRPMRKAGARDESRRPSTEAAGWSTLRRMPMSVRRTATSSSGPQCYSRQWIPAASLRLHPHLPSPHSPHPTEWVRQEPTHYKRELPCLHCSLSEQWTPFSHCTSLSRWTVVLTAH